MMAGEVVIDPSFSFPELFGGAHRLGLLCSLDRLGWQRLGSVLMCQRSQLFVGQHGPDLGHLTALSAFEMG